MLLFSTIPTNFSSLSMPHFPHTPERLLGRNDSKSPNATCKGITSTGRACRRALASPKASPVGRRTSSPLAVNGAVAIVQDGGQEAEAYCWQHKNQAVESVKQAATPGNTSSKRRNQRSSGLPILQERSSIDTLVQRLGIDSASTPNKTTSNPKPPRRTNTNDFAVKESSRPSAPHAEKYHFDQRASRRPKPKKKGFWASLCCMSAEDDDYVEIVRHRKRTEQSRPQQMTATTSSPAQRPSHGSDTQSHQSPSSNPQTNSLMSLIPQHLPPPTTSALLAELVKPISPYDEDGYIYIFWLTPSSATPPGDSTAKSLLAPRDSRPQYARRISDVMTEFSFDGADDQLPRGLPRGQSKASKKTIMLKIGRANNITRRMNEWQRQCGYALNLVRWYPYVSSSSSPQPSPQHQKPQPLYPDLSKPPTPRRESENVHKCPHVHRVERLIHLELASKQVKRQCEACGKEHREWFEVDATQDGVTAVDETVRRWIGWAERQGT